MKEIQTDIKYIKDALVNNFSQHKEIIGKIDHLSTTFQTRIGDKADQKDVMDAFGTQDKRTSKLENWQNRLIGGWIVLTIILIPILLAIIRNWKW